MTDQTLPTAAELRHEMREELAKLRADKAELLAACKFALECATVPVSGWVAQRAKAARCIALLEAAVALG